MLRPFAHPVACCYILLRVAGRCCAKFETGQTFESATPNISFVPRSPKRSANMLDSFAQLFQHCLCHARALPMVPLEINQCVTILSLEFYYGIMHCTFQHYWGVVTFVCTPLLTLSNNSQHFRANNVGSYCARLLVA